MENYTQHIRWTPGIGDPSFVGWLTVALYFIVALYCYRVYSSRDIIFDTNKAQQNAFWLFLTIAFLLLGINKQMDFQSFLTDLGRALSIEHDWYQKRKIVQTWFIQTILICGFIMIALLLAIFKPVLKANALAIIGFGVLISFVAIRASSFHHVDYFIKFQFFGIRLNWVMEICSILLVGLNARLLLKAQKVTCPTTEQ